jgi:hypothetical protein
MDDTMNNYTTNNLRFLKKHYDSLYHGLRNRTRSSQYEIVETVSGLPNLFINDDQGTASYMYSKYDPLHEAEQWVKRSASAIGDAKHVLLYGFGLGYHLEQLIKVYPEKRFYILEPNVEVMVAALEARDLTKILKHKNISVFGIWMNDGAVRNFLEIIISQLFQSFCLVVIPYYKKKESSKTNTFYEFFEQEVARYRKNFATAQRFKEEWPDNILANMRKLLSSVSLKHLKNVFADIPIFVVGSGPSLDMDMEYLKKVRNHGLIFSAGSSIQALLANGIVPDMAVTIDGSLKNYAVFKDLDYRNIPILFAPILNKQIIESVGNYLYHVFLNLDVMSHYLMDVQPDDPLFLSTASVTGTVVQAAAYLGSRQIIFVGQDLSYPNNSVYSGGVDHFSKDELEGFISGASLEIENVQGGINRTTDSMMVTIQNLEDTIALLKNVNIDFVNTSKIGARIKGTRSVPIEEVYEQIRGRTIEKGWFRHVLDQHKVYYEPARISRIVKRMEQVAEELKKFETKLPQLKEELAKLKQLIDSKKTRQLQEQIDSIDRIWNKIHISETFEHIYMMVIQAQIAVFMRYLPAMKEEADITTRAALVHEQLGAVVESMIDMNPKLLGWMKDSLKAIKEMDLVKS